MSSNELDIVFRYVLVAEDQETEEGYNAIAEIRIIQTESEEIAELCRIVDEISEQEVAFYSST